ncbi:defense/immunity protein [Lithospermum erythrorhizon]|uniref:Defense/immunity protein n=1 Tax=Lithospermum erythrorhizon TaxID=34254 RepID=A0AAV3RSQ5_LITER
MPSPVCKPPPILLFILLLFLSAAVESVEQNNALHPRRSPFRPRRTPYPFPPQRPPHNHPKRPPPNNKNINNAAELEKREFLAAHNKIRLFYKEPPLTWDHTLALYAKNYFRTQRYNDCQMIHSTGPHGENLFWGSGKHWKPSDAVGFWAEEVKYYNSKANTCMNGKMCGHYTQIVWRDSLRLGCFRGYCKNGSTYIICSYDPPGNFVGEKPFDSHV